MKYLLVKEKGKKQYSLYCPDVFGFETWGSSSYQVSLSKKRKCWYKEVWIAGNEWVDDENYQYKLNVVLETADFDEIIRCVTQRNEKELDHLFKDAREIYNQYLDICEWICERYKEEN